MHTYYTTTLGTESRKQMQFERMWNLQQIAKSLNVKLVQTFALDEPDRMANRSKLCYAQVLLICVEVKIGNKERWTYVRGRT